MTRSVTLMSAPATVRASASPAQAPTASRRAIRYFHRDSANELHRVVGIRRIAAKLAALGLVAADITTVVGLLRAMRRR